MKQCAARAAAIAALLLAAGIVSAHAEAGPGRYSLAALYDSANAHARAGRPGLAVLDYERARLLAPADPDVKANLLVTRRMAGLPAEPDRWLSRTVGEADPALVSWLGVVGVALLAGAAWAGRMAAPYRRWRAAIALMGVALVALTLANAAAIWPRLHEAIVIVGSAPARISPAPMGEVSFVLKEAEAVRILGEHEGFVLVRSTAGRMGWVWHTQVAAIVPQVNEERP